MNEQKLRPIVEASYLTAQNAGRYRTILHYFYKQHDGLRHYLFPEEVFQYVKQFPYFAEYTEEQMEQDLDQLVRWGNLIPRQETARVQTIEDFKKKRYRYQCTPYTIEIERMVAGLEQLGETFGGSLERTLFHKLVELLSELTASDPDTRARQSFAAKHTNEETESQRVSRYRIEKMNGEQLNRLWEDLHTHFKQLTENATDYLAYLKSEQVEEAMKTDQFLAFKNDFTEYLRKFISALQRSSYQIEALLNTLPHHVIDHMLTTLTDYHMSIPRMGETRLREEVQERFSLQWQNIRRWFLGHDEQDSEIWFLQNETLETIRRISRYAQRLGERHHHFRSRRKDYLYLAEWFSSLEDVHDAHRLSAAVFGVFHTRHLLADEKQTEDIESEIWEHPPAQLTIRPRVRHYREKTRPGAITSRAEEKAETYQRYLKEKDAEQRLLDELTIHNRIVIADLPEVDPFVRRTLLHWIGKCMGQPRQVSKTETGKHYKLQKLDDTMITLRAEDGNLQMPNYVLQFLDEQEGSM